MAEAEPQILVLVRARVRVEVEAVGELLPGVEEEGPEGQAAKRSINQLWTEICKIAIPPPNQPHPLVPPPSTRGLLCQY